jgi:Ca-activated chloride channel family protein
VIHPNFRTLGSLALAAAVVAAATQALIAQQARFRGGIEVVSLNVTVTDPNNRFVRDLQEPDFEVYEDGVRQNVEFFSRSQQPIALALLLDTSASMEDKLELAQEAAIGFARRLRTEDLAEVVDFDSKVDILQTFTNDRSALEQAIRSTMADGSTAIYHAIYISLKELKKVQQAHTAEEIRRQAIIVLSDGEDTSSILGYEEVLELAKRSETAIYTIGIRGQDVTSGGFKEAEFVLRQLAQETGGRSFFPREAAELPKIYEQISDELASQYTLAYTSKNQRRDAAWRRIVVRVTRPNTIARTKQGYYAPSPTSP